MYASQLHQNNRNDKRSNDSRNKKKSNANRQQNVTNKDEKNENNKHKNGEKSLNNVTDKFKEVQRKHIEAAKKHIEAYESSSEEELENNTLLESVFKNYQGEKDQLQKTQDFLENVFQCNTAACLICIRTVKRTDSIWSCENCYSFFHLNCIQRWAKDSTSLKLLHDENEGGYYNNLGEYIPKKQKVVNWCCPKCRYEYDVSEIPQQYFCFCKKGINPPNHPWIVPHSCGEMCNKPLKTSCGHRCVLLCHPGNCPPCPQIITTSCECGTSNPRTIRCSQKSWKCANKCKQKLACGTHTCGTLCHPPSECPPCMKKSTKSCVCGNKTQERNCNKLVWKCDKVCDKLYPCNLHKCPRKCCNGDCGPCPFGQLRTCPCGKEATQAPCSEEIDPCGNTCQKTLSCLNHICAERCHKGNCSPCLEVVEKKCRCGLSSKEFPCSKQFTCEFKCKKMRDCNKHACNRKCCNGQCPPCDKICGKVLSCGKHKCTSLCHNGLCYPCAQTATVKCRCGNTSITVPCGREKKTKPPKCNLPCKIPSKCHHTNFHKCHINECPSCVQLCMLENDTTKCGHTCNVKCHDAVKVQIIDKNYKPSTPWEVQPDKFELQKMPHPPCEVPVEVECIGGHEKSIWPCWNSKSSSCGRICGRKLKCGNHVCELICHAVEDKASIERDKSCTECVDGCRIPRPEGCVHPCKRRCHLPPCDACDVLTKTSCHCGLTQVYYKCGQFYRNVAPEEEEEDLKNERERQMSCGNRCIKNFPCGHRCTNLCHTGTCLNAEFCKKKMKIYCECKTRKVETTCDKVRAGFTLTCDEICKAKQLELQKATEEAERKRRQQEEEKNRQEVEEFEKKFAKKKYKDRKKQVIETKNNTDLIKWLGVATGFAVIAVGISYLLFIQ